MSKPVGRVCGVKRWGLPYAAEEGPASLRRGDGPDYSNPNVTSTTRRRMKSEASAFVICHMASPGRGSAPYCTCSVQVEF